MGSLRFYEHATKTWTELEKSMQEEEIHNLQETFMDGWKHSIPGLLEVTEFP